jgi:hypothetical protein
MKYCPRCKKEKNEEEFYNNRTHKDKKSYYCKDCDRKYYKKYRKEYYKSNRKKMLDWAYSHRKRYMERSRKYAREYYKLNKVRFLCRNTTNRLIRDGIIKKQPCKVCREKNVQTHHLSYDNPFNVIFLCNKHHLEIHNKKQCRSCNK